MFSLLFWKLKDDSLFSAPSRDFLQYGATGLGEKIFFFCRNFWLYNIVITP